MRNVASKFRLKVNFSRDFLANVHFLLYLCTLIDVLCEKYTNHRKIYKPRM